MTELPSPLPPSPTTQWRLRCGQYLGEISALCFLHLPPHSGFSPLPLLLSGSGSQIFLCSVESGELIRSFQIFEGVRVHGITCSSVTLREGSEGTSFVYCIAVYGERRTKLFNLCIQVGSETELESDLCVDLTLLQSLPKFSHWILDACFLKDKEHLEDRHLLAVGCSDNSVSLWDAAKSSMILEVHSPERSLLYSMRLWGDKLEELLIASGTIYNEIIVWRVVPHDGASASNGLTGEVHRDAMISTSCQHHYQDFEALHICRLVGHEGSIFRIAWSSDGSKLVSVSDDRSARLWSVRTDIECPDNNRESRILFGHNARVWDCFISDNLIITASEDCSCRIWGMEGEQLKVIKEHIGRGIWRCLFDPQSSVLITGGFDSGIKLHQLHTTLAQPSDGCCRGQEILEKTELFNLRLPHSSESLGLMNSKSEYVRGLCFSNEDILYITTNRGYLYQTRLSSADGVKWTELLRVSYDVPIVCMDLLSLKLPAISCGVEDWLAVGDGKGRATVVRIVDNDGSPNVGTTFSWSAEMDRQLLGIYWCKSLGHRFIFTADPRGVMKLWRLDTPLRSVSYESEEIPGVSLLAEFTSCFGARFFCLDASPKDEVLICGDLRGNMVIFAFMMDELLDVPVAPQLKISPMNHFKGAHGISTMSSISVAGFQPNHIEIRSTGADGCICALEYDKTLQAIRFVGMKQVKELSLIESVSANNKSVDDFSGSNYAAGFSSADFIIWNLSTETKVLQVSCGGWRRPHSYYLGDIPEMKNCFAFVKDEVIHIQRLWIKERDDTILPQNLHMQFHGRELHSLCIVSEGFPVEANEKSSWVVTGCEDGTVKLTRYSSCAENWSSSKLLGEHVGGSAVRSICCVSKIHTVTYDATSISGSRDTEDKLTDVHFTDNKENPVLLISVGAKRVLTSWLLQIRKQHEKKESDVRKSDNGLMPSAVGSSSISFQWLSTDMPVKNSVPQKKTEIVKNIAKKCENHEISELKLQIPAEGELPSEGSHGYSKFEDDWRYLAVTAFLVKHAGSRLTVCFVVVSCSDATLSVRALVLPYCLWFDVAVLAPLSSPVLSLQHAVVPICLLSEEKIETGNVYIAITGATDGSIAFWDLTESVEDFLQRLSTISLEKLIDCQKRPRTGRGSQGGRRWRSLKNRFPKKQPSSIMDANNGDLYNHVPFNSPSSLDDHAAEVCSSFSEMEKDAADDSSFEICEIRPLHVLNNIHQSGVNCLHISDAKHSQSPSNRVLYNIVSGGDDQALHCLTFEVLLSPSNPDPEASAAAIRNSNVRSESEVNFIAHEHKRPKNCSIQFLSQHKVASAHSSAVKGVWTDGTWVFSTGLDQRIRCWILNDDGKLTEHAHQIISVPEPEALDARSCGSNNYQIAVAGRGMQMVEFSTLQN